MKKRILTAGPYVGGKEEEYVLDAVKNGWNENWNKYLNKFEDSIAKYVGVKYAMATSSCTGAMHLALQSIGIKKGDEVIVPDLTWIATAAVVNNVGATPIFAEITPDSWTLDPSGLEKKITKKTKAIMPVHLYGYPAEMDRIMEIAKENNLYVVEDAAPSLGAEYKSKKTGSFGDISAFSFQGAKLVVTGEGGMLLSDNEELFGIAGELNDYGRANKVTATIDRIGYKYRMSNLQAAFGLAQLENIDYLIDCKRNIFNWYDERLRDIEGFKLNRELKNTKSIYWMTSLTLDSRISTSRDDLMKRLDKEFNVDTRPVLKKVSKYSMFKEADNPIAKRVSETSLNLPSGVCLKEEDIDYVCNSIKSIIHNR